MITNHDIREAARASLQGRWTNAVVTTLVFAILSCLLSLIPYATVLISLLVVTPLGYGLTYASYLYFQKKDDNMLDNMFKYGFNSSYLKYIVVALLSFVLVMIGLCLLVVPGIILSIGFVLVPYLLVERPELSSTEILMESWNMMKGHKAQFFWLMLSFIGWMLLCVLSLGIGYFWLAPYMYMAQNKFYEELTKVDVILGE